MKKWSDIQTVVVPIDFSDSSFEALTGALEIFEPSQLRVVHVLAELSPVEIGVVFGTVDDATRAESVRASFLESLAEHGLPSELSVAIRIGSAGSEICAYATEVAADLIVMPSHGLTGLSSFLLGSVAQAVVGQARCPVLVLKGDEDG